MTVSRRQKKSRDSRGSVWNHLSSVRSSDEQDSDDHNNYPYPAVAFLLLVDVYLASLFVASHAVSPLRFYIANITMRDAISIKPITMKILQM